MQRWASRTQQPKPLGRTTTPVYLVYAKAFESADTMGYACAIAYVLFFVIAVLSPIENTLIRTPVRRKSHSPGLFRLQSW